MEFFWEGIGVLGMEGSVNRKGSVDGAPAGALFDPLSLTMAAIHEHFFHLERL